MNKPDVRVRENWSTKKHSLASFLAGNKSFAKKVVIVAEDTPHVIDLHDKLGY
jgi:hypothetical protein